MNFFFVSIATPETVILETEVTSLTAPGTIGYMEILYNHAPLLSTLKAGVVSGYTKEKDKFQFAISGGILEVFQNQVTILADIAAKVENFTLPL
jgi:F-type H+-transporting ATPase subunit epsilon